MFRLIPFATLAMLMAEMPARASLSVTGAGSALGNAAYENFDALTAGSATQTTSTGITVSFVPDAAAVSGALANRYAPPYLTGANGAGFGAGGGLQSAGPDLTTYLSTGSSDAVAGARVTLSLPREATYFGLLWGSVDSYNTLSFFDGARLVGSLSGSDVLAAPHGDQGAQGSLYVNVTSDLSFDTVVASSTQYAFEFDDVAFTAARAIPEPVTAGLLGSGLAALLLMRRRRIW